MRLCHSLLVAVALSLAVVGASGCASVRDTSLPKGFSLKGQSVLVLPDEEHGTNTSASGPLYSEGDRAKLDKALGDLDLKRIVRGVLPIVVRGMRSTALGTQLRFRGKKGRYVLFIHLDRVNLVQAVVGADWYLRVDVDGRLYDRREANVVWMFRYREVRGSELNGRRLPKLRAEHLVANGARQIRLALIDHLRVVIRQRVLADLLSNIDEITPRPKGKTK
ncbi:MAG: hypothetical protein KC609_04335 [Myxococcales bacterium]|nr:hypothetical protein [Myxococcales bacterium]